MRNKSKICVTISLLVASVFLTGCITSAGPQYMTSNTPRPSSGGFNMMSKQDEIQIGRQEFARLKASKPRTRDASKQRDAERVLRRLVKENKLENEYPWEIYVFADNTPNAFALPGGKIGLFDGIFKYTQNDAGLASIIGHEMAHITSRHASQRATRQALSGVGAGILAGVLSGGDPAAARELSEVFGMGVQGLVVLPYSREAEFEADRIGVLYMSHGGYNPKESVKVFKRFQQMGGARPPVWLSTHPPIEQRIQQIRMNMDRYERIYEKKRS